MSEELKKQVQDMERLMKINETLIQNVKKKEEIQDKDKEIEILHSIIKEAREYIEENYPTSTINYQDDRYKLLQILDKVEEKEYGSK